MARNGLLTVDESRIGPVTAANARRKARVRVRKNGQSEDTICDFPGFLGSGLLNLGSGLQNLHRGFDSRRRLRSEQIARS